MSTTPTLIVLLQCARQRCGHVLLESEQSWVPSPKIFTVITSKTATCPKCGGNGFYTLNAQGQIRKRGDETPREINAEDIAPSPRMGLKMRRRLFAAQKRALNPATEQKALSPQ